MSRVWLSIARRCQQHRRSATHLYSERALSHRNVCQAPFPTIFKQITITETENLVTNIHFTLLILTKENLSSVGPQKCLRHSFHMCPLSYSVLRAFKSAILSKLPMFDLLTPKMYADIISSW